MISKGLNAYEIVDRFGDTADMVLKVYGHMFPDPQKNIVDVLNDNFDFKTVMEETVVCQKVCQNKIEH